MKILIIEEDISVSKSIRTMLKKALPKCDVMEYRGESSTGLSVIEEWKPELVIFDEFLPNISKLEFLQELRKIEGETCVILLSERGSNQNFIEYINLGISGYLLKPVEDTLFQEIVKKVSTTVNNRIAREHLYSLERILIDAMEGQLILTPEIEKYVQKQYDLNPNDMIGIVAAWLGKDYEKEQENVAEIFRTFKLERQEQHKQVIHFPGQQMVVMAIYPMPKKGLYSYSQHRFQIEMEKFLPLNCIMVAERAYGLSHMRDTFHLILGELDWNLVLGKGILINHKMLSEVRTVQLKYPEELDKQVEKAIVQKNQMEFERCFRKLVNACRQEIHEPQMIKAACMQYCWLLIRLAKSYHKRERDIYSQQVLATISRAVYWREIWEVIMEFSSEMLSREEQEENGSLLVKQTWQKIIEDFGNGITLEEVAGELHVTEEYLSSLFKKETGETFSDTIRRYRIKKIKELLKTTNLKITQIAKQTGYSDPKYMSKVFKKEVGIKPSEFRKLKNIK